MIQFDPNTQQIGKYASYIPNRRPKFKVHKNKGHASNAISYTGWGLPREGILYENIGGQWLEYFRWELPKECARCNEPITLNVAHKDRPQLDPQRYQHNKKVYEAAIICGDCYRKYLKLSYNSEERKRFSDGFYS